MTGQAKTERQLLRESEEKYRLLVENSYDIIYTLNTEGIFTFVSPALTELLGLPPNQLIGQSFQQIVHVDDIPICLDFLHKVLNTEQRLDGVEYRVKHINGEWRWHKTNAVPFKDETGKVISFHGISRDITEGKRAEEATREIGERYRQLVENANDIIFQANEGGFFTFVNPVALQLTGYTEKEILGKHYTELILPDYREKATRFYGRQFVKRLPVTYNEFPLVTKHGMTLWIGQNTQLLMDGETIVGFQSIARDITELKLMEEELRISEEKFSKAFFLSPDAIIISRLVDGMIVSVNEGFKQLSGYVEEEFVGKTIPEINIWDSPEDRNRWIEKLKAEGKVDNFEARFRTKDGDTRYGLMSASTLVINGVEHILNVVRDITERKRVEEKLEQSEEKFRTVADFTYDWEYWIGPDGRLIYNSPSCERITGYRFDEFINNPSLLQEIIHPEDQSLVGNHFHTIDSGDSHQVEFRIVTRSGETHWIGHICQAVHGADGTWLGRRISNRDITDRRLAEHEKENLRAQLLQSQKMETMGTLAGGIAHDFNNMLAIILGFSDMLLADKNEGDPGYEELQKIVKTSRDAADLVQRIRIFGRRAEMIFVPLDLNHQIDQVTKLLSSTLPKMIKMDIHLTKDPVIIKADSSQITQMVMNLAVNANEAMPQGGRLSIQTENIVLDNDYCRVHLGAKPGPHVMLTVSDTGRGIDKSLMERIFDPFYSTKTRDYRKGTGLGLSVVQGIVQQHGGHITVESEVGKGTIFRMYFPALEHEIVPEYVETKIPYSAGGTETILLVEDWEAVRELGVLILEKFGYTVLCAGDGQEALDVYEKEQGNISLVILDILMPRMDGKECLEQLLRINPAVKVIISSGVGQEDLINEVVKIGAKGAVNKPYGMRQLLGMVRHVLDGD
jgi:PAS domain S-box-containing protein